jgi:hypothetical protein
MGVRLIDPGALPMIMGLWIYSIVIVDDIVAKPPANLIAQSEAPARWCGPGRH